MIKPYALIIALATALVAVACGNGVITDCDHDAGSGGEGGGPETAYPCGFQGSPKIPICAAMVPGGLAYCGHTGPVERPFSDCVPVKDTSDAGGEWDWWCCPGAAPTFDGGASN